MVYHVIGLMSGSSLDGLDIVYTILEEIGGKWGFSIEAEQCVAYDDTWRKQLQHPLQLTATDFLLLHSRFGHFIGEQVNQFIDAHNLHHKIHFIASHGHTAIHQPGERTTFQIGDGAAIAAATSLPVITDLRSLDVALGGQGAPIVPIGEKLLFPQHQLFLNIGGIANLSYHNHSAVAFDVCPANRVLNALAARAGDLYDHGGETARKGMVDEKLLNLLNSQDYYSKSYPKSLANEFGADLLMQLIDAAGLSTADALATYVSHIAQQVQLAVADIQSNHPGETINHLLVTGGGAFNHYLMEQLTNALGSVGVNVEVPHDYVVRNKEALIMALIGTLRWREETNVLHSVTGASRDSIGGALWMGHAY
jgi:anhydro-N-acetylmuramic acid kinase